MLVFARGMISGGLEGMPRRTSDEVASWKLAGLLTAIGGKIMFVSVVLFFVVMAGTLIAGRRTERGDIPLTEIVIGPVSEGWETRFDRFRLWVIGTVILILIAYGPFLVSYLPPKLTSPGFTLF